MLVLNATPLIYLAKTGRAKLLGQLPEDVVIPESVHQEVVVEGKNRGEPDAAQISRLVEKGAVRRPEPPDRSSSMSIGQTENLHATERDVLLSALEHDGTAILDEKYGRRIAEAEGIDHGGTLYLLLRLVKLDVLAAPEMREMVDDMIEEGWYCSTKLYAEILRTLEDLE